jgi:tellurite resistance protein TerC
LLGIAFLVLPGPGLLVIPLGLAVLAIEFLWARDLLHKVRRGISEVSRRRRMGRQLG